MDETTTTVLHTIWKLSDGGPRYWIRGFPETDFKFYLDATLAERERRRLAEGVDENLAERDHRDSQRATAPLMIPLGAIVINNSGLTAEETTRQIVTQIRQRLPTSQA